MARSVLVGTGYRPFQITTSLTHFSKYSSLGESEIPASRANSTSLWLLSFGDNLRPYQGQVLADHEALEGIFERDPIQRNRRQDVGLDCLNWHNRAVLQFLQGDIPRFLVPAQPRQSLAVKRISHRSQAHGLIVPVIRFLEPLVVFLKKLLISLPSHQLASKFGQDGGR